MRRPVDGSPREKGWRAYDTSLSAPPFVSSASATGDECVELLFDFGEERL